MVKLFLIGKTGQLGGELLRVVPHYGWEVISYGHAELEVTDEAAVHREILRIRPEYIINTSAFHSVRSCEENPAQALRVNCLAVRNLARISKECGAKLITFSTDYVFDGEKGTPYIEGDPPRPLQFYGLSKLCGEYAALNAFPEGTYIIRTSGLYGGETGSRSKPGGNLILQMLSEAKNKNELAVSKEQIVSPTFAGDLARAVPELILKNAEPGIYHLVNEGYCTWADFVGSAFALQGVKADVKPIDRGGRHEGILRPKFSALKNTKAAALGIELPSWQEGLASYIKFLNS